MRRGIERAAGVRLTHRDRAALLFVADVGAIRLDDLTALLGVYSDNGGVGSRTGRGIVARWVRAGLASSQQVFAGVPSVVHITPAGRCWLGLDRRRRMVPFSQLPHALTVAALGVGFIRAGQLFVGEYGLQRELGQIRGNHRPDGILVADRSTVAVEVERTVKSRYRWDEIVGDLLQHYDAVQYWALPPVATRLHLWARKSLTQAQRQRLVVRDVSGWSR